MTLRGFITRHRLISAVAAPTALGVAAVATAWVAFAPPQSSVETELTASTTECHDMVTVSIAGRTDTPPDTVPRLVDADGNALPAALSDDYSSHWVDPVANAPAAVNTVKPGSYANLYIAYPANMDSYEDAVAAGVENTQQVMEEIRVSCPNTRFSIVGYSEGADVARRVAMNIGHQDGSDGYEIVDPTNVVGVVIFADAGRAVDQGPFPGAQNPYSNPDGFDTQYQTGENAAGGAGAVTGTGGDDFGALAGKVAAFCSDGDLTCAAPDNISLLQLAVNVGRQLNIDSLEKEGLTPATGIDVATVIGRIAYDAFAVIQSDPNWMRSNQTFLDVLLQVSDPAYDPSKATTPLPAEDAADSIDAEDMSPLAYLPEKVFNEIVNLIVTNQNTIPVVLSDPYQLTLGPDTGHHFDYWNDATDGQPLTSAEYAAQWLTQLAEDARDGKPLVTPTPTATVAPTTAAAPTTTATTSSPAAKVAAVAPSGTTSPAPVAPAQQSVSASAAPTTSPAAAATTVPAETSVEKPATTQPATTQPATTQPATTQDATTPVVTTTPAAQAAG
ncbi:cutinase family protein [Rhodococcus sp. NPDC003318]|uniref:cutinase family protein n=1 Tax=Rhodococcus sp. NPDC003318 TaxID=3364503 RepID=UPI0036ACD5E8